MAIKVDGKSASTLLSPSTRPFRIHFFDWKAFWSKVILLVAVVRRIKLLCSGLGLSVQRGKTEKLFVFSRNHAAQPLLRQVNAHWRWKVTRIWLSPNVVPAVISLALMAPFSSSYSTNAIPLRPGTRRTSLKPGYCEKSAVSSSGPMLSATWRTNRILFGGKYSSGTTPPAAPPAGLRPAPRAALTAGCAASGTAGAGRLRFFSSAAAMACLRSVT